MIKNIKKLFLFSVVFAVLLVSGCTGRGSPFSESQGAVVNQFAFDVPSIYEDEDVALSLVFENVGAKNMAGDTSIWIYGPAMDSNVLDRSKGWLITSPSGGTVDYAKELVTWSMTSSEFYPPDVERGIPGMAKEVVVVMKPMDSPEGMNPSYTFNGRMCYPYQTTTMSTLTSTGKEEYKSSGDAAPGAAITRNSAGPIRIQLKSGDKIRATGTTLPLVFTVSDVGNGFVTQNTDACNVNIDSSSRGQVALTVKVDGEAIDCGLGVGVPAVARMRSGQAVVYCTTTFNSAVPKSSYQIVATAAYNYYVDAVTEITVKAID
ncbi:MAG: hypothetical protein K0B02_00250 [DPANN group archaeon]|nr:hypothetical protein [DPANN group archaeon]